MSPESSQWWRHSTHSKFVVNDRLRQSLKANFAAESLLVSIGGIDIRGGVIAACRVGTESVSSRGVGGVDNDTAGARKDEMVVALFRWHWACLEEI